MTGPSPHGLERRLQIMTQPLVSIITRTKDRPLMLPRALQSVLSQTFQNWEMIVVNDGGRPEPVDKLIRTSDQTARSRIQVIHNNRSQGMEAASNAGIEHAAGKYLVIHDDDDTWEPEFLEVCIDHMEEAKLRVAGVVTRSIQVNETLEEGGVRFLSEAPYNPWLTAISIIDMAHENLFPPISFLFRRSVLDEIGGFREDLPVLGDWEFNLRVLNFYSIDIIEKTLARYHLRQNLKEGIYGNTVVAGLDLHTRYLNYIRNEMLQRDLQSGRFGMGFLVNIGALISRHGGAGPNRAVREAQDQMLTNLAIRLRRLGIREIIVYGAGDIGRRFSTVASSMGLRIAKFVDRNKRLWGASIDQIEISSLAAAAQEGISCYVVASFAFVDDIKKTIREFHTHNNLGKPIIYEPIGGCSDGGDSNDITLNLTQALAESSVQTAKEGICLPWHT